MEKILLSELLPSYQNALIDYGLSHSTQLQMLIRANAIIKQHDERGEQYLNDEVVAGYFREVDERFYGGSITKNHYQMIRRQTQRLIHFAESGEIRLPNLQAGATLVLADGFSEIVAHFLDSATVSPNTRNDMRWVAHLYFKWLEEKGFADISGVGAEQIQKFLLGCSKRMMPASMHNIKLYMKKLYAHLHETGQSPSNFKALLSFPMNRDSKIYPALPKEDIAKLLDAIDRKPARGKRDYAIMMLGAVLGLRACDVIALKLTDIDWIKGELRVLQAKNNNSVILPLTADVGEALQEYILKGRPKTDIKQVFLRLNAPIKALESAVAVGEIFAKYCRIAGLPDTKRFHSLRRSLGTSMVTNGVTVYDVAQVLGDADIDSTKQYISLDTKHLKICALPFDGIAVKGGDA